MSNERDVTRIVRSWLEEGATALPDRVLDNVLDRLPATHQRRPLWSVRRLHHMSTPIRIAVAAAAVLVVAVLGLNLMPRQGGVGSPTLTASPNPTVSPSPTAPPTPSPTSSPSPSPSPRANGGPLRSPQDMDISLDPGTYKVADPFALPFGITFATPWTPKALAPGDAGFTKTDPNDPGNWPAWVNVDLVEFIFKDPCHPDAQGGIVTATTAAKTLTAITHLVGFHAGPVSDVNVGGLPSKHFELTNTLDETHCTNGSLKLWTTHGAPTLPSGQQGGEPGGSTLDFWIVDHGGTPVVIVGETFQTTPAGFRDEVAATVNTITFQP
jgi:hypothetical protein